MPKKVPIICQVLIAVALATLASSCRQNPVPDYALHRAKRGSLAIVVKERCELRSTKEEFVRVPRPRRVHSGSIKISYLIEEGSKVSKGQVVAKVTMVDLWRSMQQWESDVKIARAALASAQKKLDVERRKLQMEIKKLKNQVEQKATTLELEKLNPGAREVLEAELAISEWQQTAEYCKEDLQAQEYLAQKNVVSEFQVFEKMMLYREAQETIRIQKVALDLLNLGADPAKLASLQKDHASEELGLRQAQNKLQYQLAGMEAEVAQAKKRLYRPQRLLKNAKAFLGAATLKASNAGIILHRRIWSSNGLEKIKNGMVVWPLYPIISIQDVVKMQVVAEVSEKQIGLVRKGMKAEISIDSIDDRKFNGSVVQISQVANYRREKHGEQQEEDKEILPDKVFEVVVQLQQQERRLKPGLTGTVKILAQQYSDVITIPLRAVFQAHGRDYVHLRQQRQFLKREIAVGAIADKRIIVRQGLIPGDEVVVGEIANLASGNADEFTVAWGQGQQLHLQRGGVIRQGTLRRTLMEMGNIAPQKFEEVAINISGKLAEILPEGTWVKKGQKVLVIETDKQDTIDEILLQKQAVELDVEKQQSELRLAQENQKLEIAKAQLDVQLAQRELEVLLAAPQPLQAAKMQSECRRAQIQYESSQKALAIENILFARGVASEADLSQKRLLAQSNKALLENSQLQQKILLKGTPPEDIAVAQKKLDLARLKYVQTQKTASSIIRQHQTELATSQAKLAQQDYILNYAEGQQERGIQYAPVSGILRHTRSAWGKPQIGQEYYEGQRLVTISDEKQMVVKCKINEVDRRLLHCGQKVLIRLPAIPGEIVAGEVTSISQVAVDRSETALSFIKQKRSGVMVFEAIIKITQSAPQIKVGLSAQLTITIAEHKNVAIVPRTAIIRENGNHYLYLIHDGRPQKKQVKPGPTNKLQAVIESGASPGDVYCLPLRLGPVAGNDRTP